MPLNRFKFSKAIFLFLITLLLNACAKSEYANVMLNTNKIINNKMGMIITKVDVPYTDLFNKPGKYDGYIHLKTFDLKKVYLVDGSSYLKSSTMVTPGEYYIDLIGWNDGLYEYHVKPPANKLEVKPGQCIYIGDISIIKKIDSNQILVKNNISDTLLTVQNGKLAKLTERLHFVPLIKNATVIKP